MTDSATGDGKQAKKDERNKKALAGSGQKGGGGRGARESGTKKTKNKYRDHAKGHDEETEHVSEKSGKNKEKEIPFLTVDEVCLYYVYFQFLVQNNEKHLSFRLFLLILVESSDF